jgi:hypothetical protein
MSWCAAPCRRLTVVYPKARESRWRPATRDSDILGVADGLTFRRLRPEFHERALDLLAHSFAREPSTRHWSHRHRLTEEDWREFTDAFLDECEHNCLSVVATVDSISYESAQARAPQVAAALLARDFLAPWPAGFSERFESRFGPLLAVLRSLDSAWYREHPEAIEIASPAVGCDAATVNGDACAEEAGADACSGSAERAAHRSRNYCVDLWMGGVEDSLGMKRAGRVFEHLVRHGEELARRQGYQWAVGEATGGYSQGLFASMEFRPLYETDYCEFEWEGTYPFASSSRPPHTKWVFCEKRL